MASFLATVVDQLGKSKRRKIEAPNSHAARTMLESGGLFVLELQLINRNAVNPRIKLPSNVLTTVFQLLALQLERSVPTDKALAQLRDDFPDSRVRRIMASLHDDVTSATASLSDAMAKFPRTFSPECVAAVRAAETSGRDAIARRFTQLRKALIFRSNIRKQALRVTAYPLFICTFALGLLYFLALNLMPRFNELLNTLHVPLPAITIGVQASANFVQKTWPFFVACTGAAVVAYMVTLSSRRLRIVRDRALLHCPFIGPVVRSLIIAEVCQSYHDVYAASHNTLEAFGSCTTTIRNAYAQLSFSRVLDRMFVGSAASDDSKPVLTEAFRATTIFPPLALTIISTGEGVGAIAESLENVAEFYGNQVDEQLTVALAILSRALIVLIGVVVIFVVLAVMLPAISALSANFR